MDLDPAADSFGTAAYWIDQASRFKQTAAGSGTGLEEEVAACLLGGFGMPAEVGLAAYRAVRESGLLDSVQPPSVDSIHSVLQRPIKIGRTTVHYRFPKQKSRYLAEGIRHLRANPPLGDGKILRDQLMRIRGIGFKTASWIVRNWSGSTEVAVIDIHIMRAGQAAGFFETEWRLPRDYLIFEEAFLRFACSAGLSPIVLDQCIWSQMHELQGLAPSIMRLVAARR
ncbi:MAG TPA: hypothetical protein VGR71_10920 [Nitrospira sp.]|nr:hypothetical protein [Nitrospira sp.]